MQIFCEGVQLDVGKWKGEKLAYKRGLVAASLGQKLERFSAALGHLWVILIIYFKCLHMCMQEVEEGQGKKVAKGMVLQGVSLAPYDFLCLVYMYDVEVLI